MNFLKLHINYGHEFDRKLQFYTLTPINTSETF